MACHSTDSFLLGRLSAFYFLILLFISLFLFLTVCGCQRLCKGRKMLVVCRCASFLTLKYLEKGFVLNLLVTFIA